MEEYTVAEYCRRTGKSEKTVRKYISTGKLKTKYRNIENRAVTVILVDDTQLDVVEVLPEHSSTYQNEYQNIPEQNMPLQSGNITDSKLLEFMDEIKEYMLLAGQTKLLIDQKRTIEDSEARTRDQYYQIMQEKTELKAKLDFSQQKIEELQEKLKQYEERQNKLNKWFAKL